MTTGFLYWFMSPSMTSGGDIYPFHCEQCYVATGASAGKCFATNFYGCITGWMALGYTPVRIFVV